MNHVTLPRNHLGTPDGVTLDCTKGGKASWQAWLDYTVPPIFIILAHLLVLELRNCISKLVRYAGELPLRNCAFYRTCPSICLKRNNYLIVGNINQ
ncbi:hypothetical protein NPIL_208551 [Nephila pilipes]|uniref:Uncharacterized protein n=1 Tax=Nephila pilipes TaxID=299642 RepID=A0A8X6I2W8_NEPPI|nr:hypothetical protein NPIL_208551 [Nephila pilipes]